AGHGDAGIVFAAVLPAAAGKAGNEAMLHLAPENPTGDPEVARLERRAGSPCGIVESKLNHAGRISCNPCPPANDVPTSFQVRGTSRRAHAGAAGLRAPPTV